MLNFINEREHVLHERKKIEQKNSITVQDSVIRVSYKEIN